jgi:hypothetical protein
MGGWASLQKSTRRSRRPKHCSLRRQWRWKRREYRAVDVARILHVSIVCTTATIACCVRNTVSVANGIEVGAIWIISHVGATTTAPTPFNFMAPCQDMAQVDASPRKASWLCVVHEVICCRYAIAVASILLIPHLPLSLFLVLSCFLACIMVGQSRYSSSLGKRLTHGTCAGRCGSVFFFSLQDL